MASRSLSNSVDLQGLITGAAKLELKALNAGVECWQVWISQAAKLSNIASDTLQAIENDKASLSETARRLTEFGKENAEAFAALSSRIGRSYYEELGRLVATIDSKRSKVEPGKKIARRGPAVTRKARSKA